MYTFQNWRRWKGAHYSSFGDAAVAVRLYENCQWTKNSWKRPFKCIQCHQAQKGFFSLLINLVMISDPGITSMNRISTQIWKTQHWPQKGWRHGTHWKYPITLLHCFFETMLYLSQYLQGNEVIERRTVLSERFGCRTTVERRCEFQLLVRNLNFFQKSVFDGLFTLWTT